MNIFTTAIQILERYSSNRDISSWQDALSEISSKLNESDSNLEDLYDFFRCIADSRKEFEKFDLYRHEIMNEECQMPYLELGIKLNGPSGKLIPTNPTPNHTWVFHDIQSGEYSLTTNSNRLLWQGELTDNLLLYGAETKNSPLRMAAETDIWTEEMSATFSLLNDEIIINVFPGAASGKIIIQYKGRKA